MTVASLCNDILVLAVFLLVGFFVRELCKPLQKLFLPSSLIGGLILWKHRGNIQRLIQGNESKFSLHKKKEGSQ